MKMNDYKLPLLLCTLGALTIVAISCTTRIASKGDGRLSKPTSVTSADVDSAWCQIKQSSIQITSQQKTDAFVTYLNSVQECSVPSLWSDAFVGFVSRKDRVVNLYYKQYYQFLRNIPIHCPKDVDVKRVRNGLKITLGNQNCTISNNTLKEMDISVDAISASETENCLLVATHADWALPYELFCINKNDSSLNWKSTVIAGGRKNCSGPNVHVVFIVPDKETVCVFGASSEIIYFEQFEIDTGVNTMRWTLNNNKLD
jgi:hypothetical protein